MTHNFCPLCSADQSPTHNRSWVCGTIQYLGSDNYLDGEQCLRRRLKTANLRTRQLVSAIQDVTRRIGAARRPQSIRVELQEIVDREERWGYDC